jgi:hypothetical protein
MSSPHIRHVGYSFASIKQLEGKLAAFFEFTTNGAVILNKLSDWLSYVT